MALISVLGADGCSHIIHSGDIGPNPRPAIATGSWEDVWTRFEAQANLHPLSGTGRGRARRRVREV